jgi:hypothetical protein
LYAQLQGNPSNEDKNNLYKEVKRLLNSTELDLVESSNLRVSVPLS